MNSRYLLSACNIITTFALLLGCIYQKPGAAAPQWNPEFPGALASEEEFIRSVGPPTSIRRVSNDIPGVPRPSTCWIYDLINKDGSDTFRLSFYFKNGVCVSAPVIKFEPAKPYRINRNILMPHSFPSKLAEQTVAHQPA